ncbi:LOW QUALITY PROTEIN: kinesin-like protein KIN-7O [Actinidia eriantha]|uniref:LOW QUALITY PROTEIN: kinesin-like protein KIN-7O n=1 Tax=Actinidia eriantha TaxID=165200 RepID=UPI002590C499|nr:LOW QUALITY PROTEIN: kinesin-like protein KIN-7O [Actinidia eriantha]
MERIHVTVRARPLSPEDAKTSPWRISGNSIFIPNHSSKFEFDQIFGENCKTREVYEVRTKDIVAAAVCGFNGTVFAYGQTNSGKTHTMRGSTAEPGVIPLAVRDLFDIIQEDMNREFLLRMSYMEIYNEDINDLLAPEHRKLQIHESLERGIFVAGLREEIVASPEQVLELMACGESHRHIGETNMNLYSSRSHTIFRMIIESRERSEDEEAGSSCDAVRVSVLNLVDLAGSERAAKTGAEGVRLKEGSHINKSLMTLGTVIKKLSEGAESQGGHVPYRDSKLTRILQPALEGNANTAIICNITLAQIHVDETKSSLQFSSRALRVTNCARVNEILTDAALLKRQKKEIEELTAKLQGSHSDHFEEEILNLRNTLLQTELERERIALELEEEKKAQAEREKRLQEQAKKIENLSSMVLYSNRDEIRDQPKKEKRRDTWCFGNLSRETLREVNSVVHAKASAVKSMRSERFMGPLLPFEELVSEASMDNSCKEEEERHNDEVEGCVLPDPHALLHVTSRKKAAVRKKSLLAESNELEGFQAEYEDLFLKFETQRTMSEIQIDYLTRKLAEADLYLDEKSNAYSTSHLNKSTIHNDATKSLRESEAILVIKQLQEKIHMLEMEKSSSQQNLDCVVELATEQNINAMEKYEELYEDLLHVQEEARIAREQIASMGSVRKIDMDNSDAMMNLLMDVQEITSEIQTTRNLGVSVSLVVDELLQSFSAATNLFLDFKSLAYQNSTQLKSIVSNHEKLHCCMRHKVNELESDKLLLYNQSADLQSQLQELSLHVEDSSRALNELSEKHHLEKSKLLSQIQTLEKEISSLSSSSFAREKETLRKDLEKTKSKLRETEFKLKNAIQEKTKLEGEKACAERELKKLHGQKALLERDISKRESLAGRRRDSVVDRSSNVFDPRRGKGLAVSIDQTLQEDYKRLEVLAFEMETTIASLEEELTMTNEEKEAAVSKTESLASELDALSDKLNMSNAELNRLQEEFSDLQLCLEESKSLNHKMESSIKVLVEEKEELAMQLTEALLAMEEEKAIWSAKEKASIEAIEEKSKSYNAELMLLSNEIVEVQNELVSCKEESKGFRERLVCSEENAKLEKNCSMEKSLENDRLRNELTMANDQSKRSQEDLMSKLQLLTLDHRHACEELEKVWMELSVLNKEKEHLVNQVRELDKGSVLMDDFQILQNQLCTITKERDKLMAQIEEHQNHEVGVELCAANCDERLLKAKAEVEMLTGQLCKLEAKIHNDEVVNSKEKAKLRMRLRGTQAKLDAFSARYKEAGEEMDLMNRKFEEAAAKLKSQLASYGLEVLNLKKQLAAARNQ